MSMTVLYVFDWLMCLQVAGAYPWPDWAEEDEANMALTVLYVPILFLALAVLYVTVLYVTVLYVTGLYMCRWRGHTRGQIGPRRMRLNPNP